MDFWISASKKFSSEASYEDILLAEKAFSHFSK